MESTHSSHANKRGSYLFTVEFRDKCWDSTLTEATLTNAPYTFDLWSPEIMPFTSMQSVPDGEGGCGGFSYQLEYLSGPLIASNIDHMTVYSLS